MILRNSSTKPGMTIMLTEKDTIQFKKVFDKRHSQFAAVFSFLSNIFELRVKSKLKRRHGQQVCILCLLCLKFVGSSPLSIRNKPVTGCKKPADMLPFFIQPQKKKLDNRVYVMAMLSASFVCGQVSKNFLLL